MSNEQTDGKGAIVAILIEEGIVDAEKLRYAERVRSKLSDPGSLLLVLKDLGHVDDEQIKAALSKRRLDVSIGDLLVELGLLRPEELRMALDIQAQGAGEGKELAAVLVEHRFVEDTKLTELIACQLGLVAVEPRLADLDQSLLAKSNLAWLMQNDFVPLRKEGERIVIAFADPTNENHRAAARAAFGEDILYVISPRSTIRGILQKLESKSPGSAPSQVGESQTVEIVDGILRAAIEAGASDIHIEPSSDRLRVRFRQDGVLIIHQEYSMEMERPISSRIKVLCDADIAERRRHQDARLYYEADGEELDLRVSIYVTIHGEKIVMRLLNRSRQIEALSEIGMAPHVLKRFLYDALDRPSGVVLITGPTGSGKTSTLYSCINELINPETSIITAEDPVEYVIDGIAQCSIDPTIDRGFDTTLKQIVRQDPDVIVIGEIRDAFSAETAIQAALTGHKVLTTFHTEDSIGGLVRLLNMEIEAFLVSSTVVSVVAQRLLRRVCDECASSYRATPADLQRLGYSGSEFDGAALRIGRGCDACRHTGYRGRIAVFELLVMDEPVRDAILNSKTSHEIRRLARDSSEMVSLLEDGIAKAADGSTTIQEIVRMLPRLDRPRPLAEIRRLRGG